MRNEIREYAEGYRVRVYKSQDKEFKEYLGRWVVEAINEGGHNSTLVDLVDLLKHIKNRHPDIWNSI